MNKTEEKLCVALQCSALEAQQIALRASSFVELLVRLTSVYSVSRYDLSWKLKHDLENSPSEPEGRLQKLKHKASLMKLRGQISGDLKKMWETAVEARKIEQELFYALDVYDLPIDPTVFITTLLDVMNEVGELRDPQVVRDGREIYENLAFKNGVLRDFGMQPPIHETIESRFFYTYERKHR